jgi:hypothetical protein
VGRATHDWRGAATERVFVAPKFTLDGWLGPLDETMSRLRTEYMGTFRDTSVGIEPALRRLSGSNTPVTWRRWRPRSSWTGKSCLSYRSAVRTLRWRSLKRPR